MNFNESSGIISTFVPNSKNRTIKLDKKEMKQYLFKSAFLCLLQTFVLTQLHAQIRIIDAEDEKPLAGVYLYDENTNCIAVSDKNGKVGKLSGKITASLMGYEPVTVDASTFTGDIRLKSKWNELPEIMVKKKDYAKMTGVFRDIFRNNGSTIIYREGIVDYYFSKKKGKFIRRIRACRQYEIENLRKLSAKEVSLWHSGSTDLSKYKSVDSSEKTTSNGDTTIYKAKYKGKEIADAIMEIKMPKLGLVRQIVDNSKFLKNDTSKYWGSTYITKQNINDWAIRNKTNDTISVSDIVATHKYVACEFLHDNKSKPIYVDAINDFVVTGVEYLTSKEANKEMKDKKIVREFKMPDVLPEMNYNKEKEIKDLIETDFWER